MRKLILFLFITLTLTLVGCSQNMAHKEASMKEIQTFIDKKEILTIQPVSHTPAKDHWMFKNVKDFIEDGFVIQANINVKLQDVVVVRTNHPQKIEDAIKEYKNTSLQMFDDGYGGEENAVSSKSSILHSNDKYVYFIAAPNANLIESKLNQIIKK